jgi:hypothetical protein
MSYSPLSNDFITIANSKTNNGQKDIRVVLELSTNNLYYLDDDGNFTQLTSGTTVNAALNNVLAIGNETLGHNIEITLGDRIVGEEIYIDTTTVMESKTDDGTDFTQIKQLPQQISFSVNAAGESSLLQMDAGQTTYEVNQLNLYTNKLTGSDYTTTFQMGDVGGGDRYLEIYNSSGATSVAVLKYYFSDGTSGIIAFDDNNKMIGFSRGGGTLNLQFKSLPTSSSGLIQGQVWNNGGVLNII